MNAPESVFVIFLKTPFPVGARMLFAWMPVASTANREWAETVARENRGVRFEEFQEVPENLGKKVNTFSGASLASGESGTS